MHEAAKSDTLAGPVIGGYIVEDTTWRWIFWSTLIAVG